MKVTNGTGNIIIYYTGYGIVDYENLPYIIPADNRSLYIHCSPFRSFLSVE